MNDIELDEMLSLVAAPAPPPSLRRELVRALPAPRRKVFGMPLRWVLVGGAAALCAGLGAAAFDISPFQAEFTGAVQSPDGPLYATATRLVQPPIANLKWWFLGSGSSFGGTLAKMRGSGYMHNRFTRTFTGYQYELDQTDDGSYRVFFSPLDAGTLQKDMGPFKLNGQVTAPPPLPDPRLVRLDEPFEVTLYASGGERIYDRIVVSRTSQHRTPTKEPDAATMSTMLRLAGTQVYVNGQLVLDKFDVTGATIWVHLPGQGRVIAALDSQHNPRFVQGGHVNGNVMEFEAHGTQFRIVCGQPITAGGDRPIFVYHQRSFEDSLDPASPLSRQPILGSAGPASLHVE
jgi:hypothetical protein